MEYITDFISNLLPTVIHHRNQLKHRSVIHKFHELFDAASLDIDFSENLSVICKEQPQVALEPTSDYCPFRYFVSKILE